MVWIGWDPKWLSSNSPVWYVLFSARFLLNIAKLRWIFEEFDFYLFLKFLQLEKTWISKASCILHRGHQNSKWNSKILCSGTQKSASSSESSSLNTIAVLQEKVTFTLQKHHLQTHIGMTTERARAQHCEGPTCQLGGTWAPNPNAGNSLSLERKGNNKKMRKSNSLITHSSVLFTKSNWRPRHNSCHKELVHHLAAHGLAPGIQWFQAWAWELDNFFQCSTPQNSQEISK